MNGLTNVLSSLDPNTVSLIPQPSTLKRQHAAQGQGSSSTKRLSSSNKRQSIIGAPRVLNIGQATTHRSSSFDPMSARSSNRYAAPGITPRRSSIGNHRVSVYNQNPLANSRDPRPLRDKQFQAQMQQEIYEFLSRHNFEIEMKHPLSQKTLRIPTQKDFVLIFQWLYRRIDPGYTFQKSIEQEVYFVLKMLQYPYLESVNKSQISAVGGSSWPTFLGMLHWLVQLSSTVMKFDNSPIEAEPADESFASEKEVGLEQIFTKYILTSYKAYLNNEDDYSRYFSVMEEDFKALSGDMDSHSKKLEEQQATLSVQLAELNREYGIVQEANQKSQVLESDLIKFKAYIQHVESRKPKWPVVLENITSEISRSEEEEKSVQHEIEEINAHLIEKGFTIQDLNRMNTERDQLSKNLDSVNDKIQSLSQAVKDKQEVSQQFFSNLESLVNSYNSHIYKILNTLDVKNTDFSKFSLELFEITSFSAQLISDEGLGQKPDSMIPELRERNLKSSLHDLKGSITKKVHATQDDTIKKQEELDLLNENVNEQKETLENLESKLNNLKMTYDELYSQMMNDSSQSKIDITKLTREVTMINMKTKETNVQINQNFSKINLEFNQLQHEMNDQRLELHNKVEKVLEYVINFKLNIQGDLEEFENLVIEECEQELLH